MHSSTKSKIMKRIALVIIGLCVIYVIYQLYSANTSCYLKGSICTSEFKYSNSVERSLYINNKEISSDQKQSWINNHHIYPKGENGYWNYCKEYSKSSIVCSFQYLVNISKCKDLSVDKYPIDNWRLRFYKISMLDREKLTYTLELYEGKKDSWMQSQLINTDQEVLCDSEVKPY